MRVANIIGARPQFIKSAVVLQALRRAGLDVVTIHTGQHYDFEMSQLFFKELSIPDPEYNLGIGSGTHGLQTGQMLVAIETALFAIEPDVVVIYGDTNSTLAGALAASKLKMRIAHVESGLRSFNRDMAEEINRIVADHVSDILFAPTTIAVQNLKREGIPQTRIFKVGDVMVEAALHFGCVAETTSDVLDRLHLTSKSFLLVTVHRAENTDDHARLREITDSLITLGKKMPIVFPMHPRTRNRLQRAGLLARLLKSVHVIEPSGYLDMIMLQKHARLTITDSGGIQKEAFIFGCPCLTLRTETEWVELVEIGWNRILPPTSKDEIVAGVYEAIDWHPEPAKNPYSEGDSSNAIAQIIVANGGRRRNVNTDTSVLAS